MDPKHVVATVAYIRIRNVGEYEVKMSTTPTIIVGKLKIFYAFNLYVGPSLSPTMITPYKILILPTHIVGTANNVMHLILDGSWCCMQLEMHCSSRKGSKTR